MYVIELYRNDRGHVLSYARNRDELETLVTGLVAEGYHVVSINYED